MRKSTSLRMPKRPSPRASTHAAVPTIRQVAQRAGVSTATVSRVLAGPDKVRPELRQRVQQAVRLLGYHPSRVARSLRAGTSLAVGVVIPDIQNPFFTGLVRGIENVLLAAGYTLLLANSDEIPAREEQMLATLRAEGVAGLVFVPIAGRTTEYRPLADVALPIVAVDRLPAHLHVDLVTVDNARGSRRAVEHLLGLGHRLIGLIGGPPRHSTAQEREHGYRAALQDARVPIRAELMRHGDFRDAGGYAAMRALLALRHPPTAVFVANNLMTLGALRALHEADRRIPSDVALVGFDDMPWATSLNPPLTAVSQPALAMGETAAELLLARIAEPTRPVRHVVLDTDLVIRASCGAPQNAPLAEPPLDS